MRTLTSEGRDGVCRVKATREQVKGVIQATMVIAESIRELRQVPSGHIYAHVCSVLTLQDYQAIIETLKCAGVVREENNLLTWVAP